ncbi:hypothetical protein TW80_07890 [Loktanella sp. S4079]|nr:hypothetical protein TW80_07890 [Loktanella sp. S4079]
MRSLVAFLMIGGGFSIFYAVTTAVLISVLHTPPFWTSVTVFTACVPPAFLAQQHLAFRAKKLRQHAFLIYAATQIFGIALVSTITTRFVTYDIFWDTIIMGVTVAINAIVGFLIGRFVTFNPVE